MENQCVTEDVGNEETRMNFNVLPVEYPEAQDSVNLTIGKNCNQNLGGKLRKLFEMHYQKKDRPAVSAMKCESKLNFENIKPFQYPPRRLSYLEKAQVITIK